MGRTTSLTAATALLVTAVGVGSATATSASAAACTPTQSVGTSVITKSATSKTIKDTFATTRLDGGKVKVAVRATPTMQITVAVTATADACPHGASHPATVTTTTPWSGTVSKAARSTAAAPTFDAAKKKARIAATAAAVKAAANAARNKAILAGRTPAINAAIAASNGSTQPPPAQTELDKFRALIINETLARSNVERANAGAGALTSMKALSDNALIWAQHLGDTDTQGHSSSEFKYPSSLTACDPGYSVSEIIAYKRYVNGQAFNQQGAKVIADSVNDGWMTLTGTPFWLLLIPGPVSASDSRLSATAITGSLSSCICSGVPAHSCRDD